MGQMNNSLGGGGGFGLHAHLSQQYGDNRASQGN